MLKSVLSNLCAIIFKFYIIFFVVTCLFFDVGAQPSDQVIVNLEKSLTPYFESKIEKKTLNKKARDFNNNIQSPTQGDLFKVAQHWPRLSRLFKQTYTSAITIPSTFKMFKSPGFGIEIYYTIEGIDAVDSADQYSYEAANWRIRADNSNQIPDYIDEVAFSIDSAWSMEIVRFKFPIPPGITSVERPSKAYKIVVDKEDPDIYGITFPVDKIADNIGFSSIIYIRNNWKGWNINANLNYESHPEKALRITACHEFFHSIQYGLTHSVVDNVYLDGFPISWLEGTATLMENVGYDSIRDYSQFISYYFTNPGAFKFFSGAEDLQIYSNSLLTQFMYHKSSPSPSIQTIKNVFEKNAEMPLPFSTLLHYVSEKNAVKWSELLNRFHAESYFTGDRANSEYFLSDASMMPKWNYNSGEINTTINKSLGKYILPGSMQVYSYKRTDTTENSLWINYSSIDKDSAHDLSISVILNGSYGDTLIENVNYGKYAGIITIENWRAYNEAVVIASNGNFDKSIQCTITILESPVPYRKSTFSSKEQFNHNGSNTFFLNGRATGNNHKRYSGICIVKNTTKDKTGKSLVTKHLSGVHSH